MILQENHNVFCQFCREEIPPGGKYCICCGKDLSGQTEWEDAPGFSDPDVTLRLCIKCGKDNPAYARYCSECGHDMDKRESKSDPLFGDDRFRYSVGPEEALRMQQHVLEAAYVRQRGLEPGDAAAEQLFPWRWYSDYSPAHIKALTEAMEKNILLADTETWNRELLKGVRQD